MNIGLVTDQGTPIISDPGYIIAREVINNGLNVISLPGATAFVPALTSSGISPSPFIFYGFLNAKNSKQKKELESLKNLKYTMIFYEAPHKLVIDLARPGSFIFVRSEENVYFDVPISILEADIDNNIISIMIEIRGVKTNIGFLISNSLINTALFRAVF